MRRILKKALREPLVHFLILGLGIFLLAGMGRDSNSQASDKIVVTAAQTEQLLVGFARTWQRPPTEQELKGLVDDYIREEVLYREALALGLDRDDTIVRRRMRQKLEFLTEDPGAQAPPPTEQDLQTYLDQHADKYRQEPRVAFEQIFFSPDRRAESAETDARLLLAQLNGRNVSTTSIDTAGDPSLLPVEVHLSSQSEIARLFGDEFAKRLAETDPGRWAGPFQSSYGPHLVLVRERMADRIPQLAEVRDDVLRDILADRRRQLLEVTYSKLLQRYSVIIEQRNLETDDTSGEGK